MTEPHQFEAFMRDYQNMVYSTAYRLLGNATDAEDIAQEAFLKAYTHFGELRENPAAGGWLKTVTRKLALNHLTRYRARWRFFSEFNRDEEDGPGYEARLAGEDATEQEAETADQRAMLERALNRLPEAQRVPLVLYHFEHLSYDEIARRLKVSLGKVKTDIHRGREALRRRLTLDPVVELSGT
ncbi:MAG: sigma-70 family RNA polymerase sigma factor [Verrucomicrobiae bacterium]|nr:sigma-70 family RNA polymerase sigma factor [Verrucomicrobiae bacterium]